MIMMKPIRLSTGSTNLDNLFGAYETQTIHLFFGMTAVGKTTLSTYVPIARMYNYLKSNNLLKNSHRFIVVDGDGGFDLIRAQQIWEKNGCDVDDLFNKLIINQPTEFYEQHNFITKDLPKMIKEENIIPAVISADPMVALYRGVVLRSDHTHKLVTIGDYTGKLDLQLVTLRQLAVKYNALVCCSTWSGSPVGAALQKSDDASIPQAEQKFIGGRQFGFLAKVIVELKAPDKEKPLRIASLYKHRSKPAGEEKPFLLCDWGVKDP
jgi:RecA/RadA recombinase